MVMLKISEREQRSYVGGGAGTYEDPYTVAEFDMMCANGMWNGGYVEGWGYTFSEVTSYGSYGGNSGYYSYDGYGDYYFWGYYGDPNTSDPWGDFPGFEDDAPFGYYLDYYEPDVDNYPGYNNGFGDNGYGYNYDYGYQGGGNNSGNGTSHGDDNHPGNQLKWDLLYQEFLNRAAALGFNLSELNITVSNEEILTSRAGKDVEGNIFLYSPFFNAPSNDQFSVIIHECIHVENDIPYDAGSKCYFSTNMSESARRYLSRLNYGETAEDIVEELKKDYSESQFSSPQKFLNEIAAYEKEIELCPDVSEEYRDEREGKLYLYREFYRIAMEAKNEMNNG
jgi:hypothetical protein